MLSKGNWLTKLLSRNLERLRARPVFVTVSQCRPGGLFNCCIFCHQVNFQSRSCQWDGLLLEQFQLAVDV